jgi:hypothetical protein
MMINKYFKLERKNIALVQFIIEGYGNMANVTTVDSRAAIIKVSIMNGFLSDMNHLLDSLKDKYKMEEISLSDIK